MFELILYFTIAPGSQREEEECSYGIDKWRFAGHIPAVGCKVGNYRMKTIFCPVCGT